MTIPPRGHLRAYHFDPAYNFIQELPISDQSASWEEQLSDAGSGSVVIQAYNPDGTPFARPVADELVTFQVADGAGGWVNAWSLFVEDDEKVRVGATIGARKITVNGRGPLAMYEDTLVYPTLGYTSYPVQVDMYYDWRHREFDDTAGFDDTPWVSPNDYGPLSQYLEPAKGGTVLWGTPGASWNDMPHDPTVNDPHLLGPPSSSADPSPLGHWYLRHTVSLPKDGTYLFFCQCDNRTTVYLDSVPIGTSPTGGDESIVGWMAQQISVQGFTFYATAGTHTLALDCENVPRGDGNPFASNRTAVVYSCYVPMFPLLPGSCVFSSNDGGILVRDFPAQPPGMSPGKAVRLFIVASQAYGDLPLVDISSFNDLLDSNGNAWPTPHPTISTKTLTDGLTFLREISGTYMDWRADRDNPFRLLLYAKDTMNAVPSGESFLPGTNVVGMTVRRDYKIANVLVGVTQNGFVEVNDPSSVSANQRHVARFELGSVDNPFEAARVLTEALGRYAVINDEISVTVDGPVGYLDYDLGQTAPTLDSDDDPVTERIMAISARQSVTGRALTTPTLHYVLPE